jgi:glycosyltransferase involved in cell wall biosynthesis
LALLATTIAPQIILGIGCRKVEQETIMQRALIVIPAYNEEKTIAGVIHGLRQAAPEFDRIVIDDRAKDGTAEIVAAMGEKQLRLPCNLGYGYAVQTGLKYALERGYEIVITFDADGQHRPEDVRAVVQALIENNADMVIGSRYCHSRAYSGPTDRKLGQLLFSRLTRLLIGQRIYDTTSGFKAMRAPVCKTIINGVFMDFHIESIVRMSMAGFKIIEHPIMVRERVHGRSMHSYMSIVAYPSQTLLLTLVATMDALLARRAK